MLDSKNFVENVTAFLDMLFEGQSGLVYTPTKSATGYWQTYFFKYPQQKTDIVTHVLGHKNKDVYLAPSLFNDMSPKKEHWKGTNYVWVEFDGNAPAHAPTGIPEPSIKIQSSTQNHQHWYWKLKEFQTNIQTVEDLAKRLAYTLESDRSGWDATQVLRPPGTLHRESGRRVRVISADQSTHRFVDFKSLVDAPPDISVETNLDKLPPVADVIAKYRWSDEALEIFRRPTQKIGSRSSAYARLALECVEMGMSNEEVYAILHDADERWKKYATRPDRVKRLTGIINYARGKIGLRAELALYDREPAYLLGDFLDTEIEINWVYNDLLLEQGLGVLASLPGFGKSTLSFRLGLHASLGKDFLDWKKGKGPEKRVGIFSFEMNRLECKVFLDSMMHSFTSGQQDFLRRNVVIYPIGYNLALDRRENQQIILDIIDQHELDFIIIDSLKSVTNNLQEERVARFYEFLNKDYRHDRKGTAWIIHHNRKPEKGQPQKPRGIEDIFGSTFITADATAVLSLWRRSKVVLEVVPLKIRMALEPDPFLIQREPFHDYRVLGPSKDIKVPDEETQGVRTSDATSAGIDL